MAVVLEGVDCNGRESTLLECGYREPSNCRHNKDVSVRCILRVDQKVKNITVDANVININVPSAVHTALISWVLYNSTMDEPASFDVKCSNEQHSIKMSVNGHIFTTYLVGLLPSASYNCCVSAVYERPRYQSDGICDEIGTPELFIATTVPMIRASETNVVGGVLGFIVMILLVLLIISGVALAYLLLKRKAIPTRYINMFTLALAIMIISIIVLIHIIGL